VQLTTFKPTVTATVAHMANFEMPIAICLVVQARLFLLTDWEVLFNHLATLLQSWLMLLCERSKK